MEVAKIEYPTALDKIEDLTDDNIDIFVTLDDGYTYTLVVSTLKNVGTLMNEKRYSEPGCVQQLIIVEELSEELIKIAVEAYAEDEDGMFLKVSNLATGFEMKELDAALERRRLMHNGGEVE
ncbi:hypothetical protein I6N96_10895 [Enterococcus sp. BWM-S5]|uniref:Uncharacterized protein n=1 Tax=Enterococcus larvae TaxID=2794352 RepID=A0ABS4CJH2_9ENTE|nr:hypothetical protein [Enterococcus larvae]MBP1046773.1 hypothetical protein [Enterococcus larvae]